MQAISAQSSVFVAAPRLSKAASTSKVTACATRRAAQPVRCMAFDAKKTTQTFVSVGASLSMLIQPAMADYDLSADLKGMFDTPAAKEAPVEAAPASAPAAGVSTIMASAKAAPALAEMSASEAAELKAKALSLKAELQAGLEKDNAAAAEKKAPKQFASKSAKAPASASTKVAADEGYKAPPAPKAKESGDPSFLYAMLILFSPFILVTGYNVANFAGAVGRSLE